MNMLEQVKSGLVISCQVLPDESLHSSFIIGRVTLTAKQGSTVGVRVQSKGDIIEIKKVVDLLVIGVVKRSYPDSDIYTAATRKELDELFETGCEMIAMGATLRDRPGREKLKDFVNYAHEHDVLAMADCSTCEECVSAENTGSGCVSTTLCGCTPYSKNMDGPNLELFKKLAETTRAPILAEGKINTPKDLAAVYEAGAYNAVVGGAITRLRQITERSVKASEKQDKQHSFDKIPERMCSYMRMTTFGCLFLLPAGIGSKLLKVLWNQTNWAKKPRILTSFDTWYKECGIVHMNMRVMKFGGTSLHGEATRKCVYRHVLESSKTNKVIVVISVMGRYSDTYATDTLLSIGSKFFTRQGKARLVSIGERLSAPKTYSELLNMEIRAYALPFFDYGVLIGKNYDYARVLKLDHTGIRRKLNSYDVLVADDFTGVSPSGHMTTLGRGDSDYSAVLFADILDLGEADIYTDVDSVYDKDPKLNEYAIRYDKLTYDEMLNVKSRVLHDRCVSYAKDHHIRIYLKRIFSISPETIVED